MFFIGERYDIELNFENVNEGVYDIFVYLISGNNFNFKNESLGYVYFYVINNNLMEMLFNVLSEEKIILNCYFVVYLVMLNWICIFLFVLKILNCLE